MQSWPQRSSVSTKIMVAIRLEAGWSSKRLWFRSTSRRSGEELWLCSSGRVRGSIRQRLIKGGKAHAHFRMAA